jgi:hypothetical protein
LRYVLVDALLAQWIIPQINEASLSQPGVALQRRDVAYLVIPKVEPGQVGEALQGRDVAYLVIVEVEASQDSEALQRRECLSGCCQDTATPGW